MSKVGSLLVWSRTNCTKFKFKTNIHASFRKLEAVLEECAKAKNVSDNHIFHWPAVVTEIYKCEHVFIVYTQRWGQILSKVFPNWSKTLCLSKVEISRNGVNAGFQASV